MSENTMMALKMLESSIEEDRLQGLRLLGQTGIERALGPVLAALGDESWRVRKEAAELFLGLPNAGELAGQIVEFLHAHDNAGLRNAAVDILVRLGRPALPFLLEELTCPDQDVRKFVLDILGETGDEACFKPMIEALGDGDENVRAAAAENLGKLGFEEAVPFLLDAMADADLLFRFTILESLAQIGAALPVERLLVYREQGLLRKALFDCFGRIGGLEVLSALVEGLCDEMRNVREAAAMALARLATQHPREVKKALVGHAGTATAESVANLLASADLVVQKGAVQILGLINDERYAPRLLELFDLEELRGDVAAALIALAQATPRALTDLWEEADTRSRIYLCYLFGESQCPGSLDLLLDAIGSDDPDLVLVASRSLGKVGDIAVMPQLVKCLVAESAEVRETITQALVHLAHKHDEETFRCVGPLLENEDPEVRMHAINIIGHCDNPEVADSLSFALKDESPHVRGAAVRALEGKNGGTHFNTLRFALTDEDSEVRRLAAEVLGASEDPEALSPLGLALQDQDIWVRSAAVRSLGRIGDPEAVSLIVQAVQDPVGLVGIAALETLAEVDPEIARPLLIQSLSHADEEVVCTAIKLLSAAGDREWIGRLSDVLLNHHHWDVRSSFVRALGKLAGTECRSALENRLLVEGEDLVRQQIRDVLDALKAMRG